jgi:hypothetical protein
MGREVVDEGLAADFDPLEIVIDVRQLGISGMQAAEWLRADRHVDVGGSDTCRISASITYADDDETEKILLDVLRALVDSADSLERRPPRSGCPRPPPWNWSRRCCRGRRSSPRWSTYPPSAPRGGSPRR